MTFWLEVAAGFLGSVFAGLFFAFWYAILQWFLHATDVKMAYNWSWDGPYCHPNLDIRNRSKSRTYFLADIKYQRSGEGALVWIDRESVWGKELKPGSINFISEVAPIRGVSSIL